MSGPDPTVGDRQQQHQTRAPSSRGRIVLFILLGSLFISVIASVIDQQHFLSTGIETMVRLRHSAILADKEQDPEVEQLLQANDNEIESYFEKALDFSLDFITQTNGSGDNSSSTRPTVFDLDSYLKTYRRYVLLLKCTTVDS